MKRIACKPFAAFATSALVLCLAACGGPTTAGSGSDATSTTSVASTTSTTSITSVTSTTDPTPATRAPERGATLLELDEGGEKLAADMQAGRLPTSCNVLYDEEGGRPDITLTDPEDINKVYELLSRITVAGESGMSWTDSYHYVSFTLADGTTVSYHWEGMGILAWGDTTYQVFGDRALWAYVHELQDDEMGVKEERAYDLYYITIGDGEEWIEDCPFQAMPGERVSVSAITPLDVDFHVCVDGKEIQRSSESGKWEFEMPDHDVELSAYVTAYPDGE